MNGARHAFDLLEQRLAALPAEHLGPALAGAAAVGWLRNRLSRRWPSPDQVQSLFPHLAPRAAARAAWSIGALEARNRLLTERIRKEGLAPVRPLVRTAGAFAALRPPLILGMFHVGPIQALGAAVERLPGPVLVMRLGTLYAPSPPVQIASTEGNGQQRAAAFRRAISHLAGGGFVVVAFDVSPAPGLRAPCLGRTLEVARGPLALARLTGAPVRPLVARWHRNTIQTEVGEALAVPTESGPEGQESALATAAARWLEGYLLQRPAELGLGLLRSLLGLNAATRDG
ncbi:MAG TPA: hypothetical protein VGG20_17830 [Thermoanaerobaculia bacterium]